MMTWNFIDLLLILIVLISIFFGWRRGLILGLLDLLQWIGGLLLGLRFYQPVGRFLARFLNWSDVWLLPLAFILTATFAGALIHLLGYLLLRRLPKGTHEKAWNRWSGILPGLLNGLITAAITASLLLALPLSETVHRAASESHTANRLAESTTQLETALRPIFDEAVSRGFNILTIRPEPESNERVNLPYKVANTQPKPGLEAQMLELVNSERRKAGVKPLEADPELTEVARRYSADMFARGYFSHASLEGKSPFDRIREAGVSFRVAGENLALAPTLSLAHTGLMNSPGHRANILRPQFGRVGIGIMDGGMRGLMVTQNFRD
jgi:uncharacterized protein YkwD